MKLSLTTNEPPRLSVEEIRRGIEDSAALARLAKRFEIRLGPGVVSGKRGPKFKAQKAS